MTGVLCTVYGAQVYLRLAHVKKVGQYNIFSNNLWGNKEELSWSLLEI